MDRRDRIGRRVAAVAGVAGLLAAGCGSSSHASSSTGTTAPAGTAAASASSAASPTAREVSLPAVPGTISGPGVTADTITIGQITTTTGPIPGLFQDANDGLDAYAAYVNANGGLAGHKLKVIHEDDALSCNNYTSDLKDLSSRVFALVGTFTIEDNCGGAVLKANPELINIEGEVLDPSLYSSPNTFTPTPIPPGYTTTGYLWVKQKFPNDITHTAALIPSPSVAPATEQEITAQSVGYKYVYKRIIGPLDTNFTSDILRMKNAGVKIVDLGADPIGVISAFIQQSHQQGLKLDAIISAPAYDGHLFNLLGDRNLANNLVYSPLLYSLYLGQDRTTNPGLNTFLTWLNKDHPNEAASIYSVSAWGSGVLFTQALASAGAQITQSSTLQALAHITSFDSGGLTATFNPGQRKGANCMVIAAVQNGAWTRVYPKSGFDCNGTYLNVPLSEIHQ